MLGPMSSETPEPRRRFGRRRAAGKPGRLQQMRQVYDLTRREDPSVTWWILGAVMAILALAVLIGLLTGHVIYAVLLGLPTALLAAMIILSRKADAVMHARLAGQPGAAGVMLRTLRGNWIIEEEPVAVDPRTYDSVFRVTGRPGVVLIGDGPSHRIAKMLAAEEKKHRRYISNTPITLIQAGDGDDQVPMKKLTRHITKLKPILTKDEISKVSNRLRSMPGLRAPIPKGVDPTRVRPDRRSMRGR